MNTQTAPRWASRLFTVLWIWVAFRTLLPWLVFFRLTFEGDSYAWGTTYFGHPFHSAGLARPDFLVVYGLLAAGLGLLWLMRRYQFSLAAPFLVGYLAVFAADAAYELTLGEPLVFRGDTLDVTLNISAPYYLLQFAMLAAGILWWRAIRDVDPGSPPTTPVWKRRVVALCGAMVPVQLVLLMGGEPHALTDELGVVLTLLQGALLASAAYPGTAGWGRVSLGSTKTSGTRLGVSQPVH